MFAIPAQFVKFSPIMSLGWSGVQTEYCFTVICGFESAVSQTQFNSTLERVEERQEEVVVRFLEAKCCSRTRELLRIWREQGAEKSDKMFCMEFQTLDAVEEDRPFQNVQNRGKSVYEKYRYKAVETRAFSSCE